MTNQPPNAVTPGPRLLLWIIVFAVGMALFSVFSQSLRQTVTSDVSYTQFKTFVADGRVRSVLFQEVEILGILSDPLVAELGQNAERIRAQLPPVEDPALFALLEDNNVDVRAKPNKKGIADILLSLAPVLLIIGFWFVIWRRMSGGMPGGLGGGGRDVNAFLRGRSHEVEERSAPNVTFDDFAGQENAKQELAEILEFLRTPERYARVGATVPHGILLQGAPGTGKTLLARALAGEAQVPFFHLSASEFIEVFVGVGASRVRKLFEDAKKAAPAIIFIDELDSIGRVRGAGFGGGHDEREQTLNQILAEMDGFEGHEAVVVIAATNRPDVLDPALLRPGRFDRHITLELPDVDARVAIFKVHSRNVPLARDVDLETIARGVPGFSGADIKNLVNEAAMAAARENVGEVTARHFDEMRDRIMMGTLRTMVIHKNERHRLAIHEAGHTAVAYYLPDTDPIHKVTIIPRGRSLGSTYQLPELERHTLPEQYLRSRLAVTLAGRASEQLFLESLSSGADEDIRSATLVARAMVGRWGMSEEVGPVDVRESDEHPFLGREIALPRHFSEATATSADVAVRRILLEAEELARLTIEDHRTQIERLVGELEAKETLDRAQVAACLGPKVVETAKDTLRSDQSDLSDEAS
jgi:cell division protease FtsH